MIDLGTLPIVRLPRSEWPVVTPDPPVDPGYTAPEGVTPILWNQATYGVVESGGYVIQWDDKQNPAYSLVPPLTATDSRTFVTTVEGRTVLAFPRTDAIGGQNYLQDNYRSSGGVGLHSSIRSLFVLAYIPSLTFNSLLGGCRSDWPDEPGRRFCQIVLHPSFYLFANAGNLNFPHPNPSGNWYLMSVVSNGSGQYHLWTWLTRTDYSSPPITEVAIHPLKFGAAFNGSGEHISEGLSPPAYGCLAEVLWFDVALSVSDAESTIAKIMTRWGF